MWHYRNKKVKNLLDSFKKQRRQILALFYNLVTQILDYNCENP